MAWGIHRLPQRKGVPYATPIPLVFSWPARWGDEVVEIDEVVSNIDIAPTICAIAGCEMGPFKDGPVAADGLSLLPLLDGADRRPRAHGGARGTSGPLRRRHRRSGPSAPPPSIRWACGTTSSGAPASASCTTRAGDPWELTNLARDGAYAEVLEQLAADLQAEFPGWHADEATTT